MTEVANAATITERMLAASVGLLEAEADALELNVRQICADWQYCRQAIITGGIGGLTASSVYQVFDRWMHNERSNPVKSAFHLSMNSSNGSHIQAFATYDTVRLAQKAGHDVVIQATGMMDTTPAMLMQAAKKRVMTPRSWLMISEANLEVKGNTNAHKDRLKFMRQLEEHCWKLLLSRTGDKLTLDTLKEKTYRGANWWVSADEAKDLGLIDDVSASVITAAPWHQEDLSPQADDSWIVRKKKAQLRKTLALAEIARLKRLNENDSLFENGKVMFYDEVSPSSCAAIADALYKQVRRGSKDIDLLLNSPGGCVYSGSGLMDVIDTVKSHGRNIDTTIIGLAASMGGVLSQTGRERRMAENAYFMIHQVSSMFGGATSHAEDNAEGMERLQEDLFKFMAERTGGKLKIEDLKAKCNEHDWWLTPIQAQEAGLIDTII
jgi:ATP-dependent Clp protease protease subunit